MGAGRVALKRGPLVYRIEEVDNPGGRVQRLKLPLHSLSASGTAIKEGDWSTLYRTSPPNEHGATLTALPYYLWANRGQGSMLVWIPER